MDKKKIAALLAAALLALCLVGCAQAPEGRTDVTAPAETYPPDLKELDLRDQDITLDRFQEIQAQLPECHILWDVPFQGGKIPSDAEKVIVSHLTDGDVELLLTCFPQLKEVQARVCRDYPQLMALKAGAPECAVSYGVALGDRVYPQDTRELTLHQADGAELLEKLGYMPGLEKVHFVEPDMDPEDLLALREKYPETAFTWEKTAFGAVYPDDVTELDFSGTPMESVDEVEGLMGYFPSLEKVVLCDCGLENEDLAAYRERAREQYKVAWSVKVGYLTVRTDATTFMPIRENFHVRDMHMGDLHYCEDMIVVDVGHMGIKNIDWVYSMPHLQFLVLADTWVEDITPIGTLKELIYLELFLSHDVHDYTPLLNCTALQDVNMAYTKGDARVLAQMTWLKHLWVNGCGLDQETKDYLRESLPNTVLEMDHGWHMGNGWRDVPNYYVMRDILQMPYYDWGSKRLTGRK